MTATELLAMAVGVAIGGRLGWAFGEWLTQLLLSR